MSGRNAKNRRVISDPSDDGARRMDALAYAREQRLFLQGQVAFNIAPGILLGISNWK